MALYKKEKLLTSSQLGWRQIFKIPLSEHMVQRLLIKSQTNIPPCI